VSGQWDATSQLLSHGLELRNTASRLPYLQAFAPDVVAQALSQAKA
jgi:3-isopropylmalate/(R)-2-methylmalate dehydratase small subunit